MAINLNLYFYLCLTFSGCNLKVDISSGTYNVPYFLKSFILTLMIKKIQYFLPRL